MSKKVTLSPFWSCQISDMSNLVIGGIRETFNHLKTKTARKQPGELMMKNVMVLQRVSSTLSKKTKT
jgi:hypothetical protein